MGSSLAGSAGAATAQGTSKQEPIAVAMLRSDDPGVEASGLAQEKALRAAVKAQNARGGIGGRKVVVKVCKSGLNDSNGAVACANDLIADPSVVAFVGNSGTQSDAVVPLFEEAGIASIGPLPLQPSDFTSPNVFNVSSGAAVAAGQATLLADEFGIKKIGLAIPAIEGTAQLTPLANIALAPRGAEISETVSLALDKQDYSAEVTQLANSADGLVLTTTAEQMGRLLRAAESTGAFDGKKLSTNTSTLTPEVIETVGSLAHGMYVTTGGIATTDVKAPGVKRYLKEMKKYASLDYAEQETVKLPWLGFQVFAAAAENAPTVDRASVFQALNQLVYDPEGFAPTLDYTKPGTLLSGAVPRLVNTSVMYARVDNKGNVKALRGGEFVNPFEPA
jgi:ABC-type branched-subunit amino acid transport system substrate-binding protein